LVIWVSETKGVIAPAGSDGATARHKPSSIEAEGNRRIGRNPSRTLLLLPSEKNQRNQENESTFLVRILVSFSGTHSLYGSVPIH
jgi:hypothetical protein